MKPYLYRLFLGLILCVTQACTTIPTYDSLKDDEVLVVGGVRFIEKYFEELSEENKGKGIGLLKPMPSGSITLWFYLTEDKTWRIRSLNTRHLTPKSTDVDAVTESLYTFKARPQPIKLKNIEFTLGNKKHNYIMENAPMITLPKTKDVVFLDTMFLFLQTNKKHPKFPYLRVIDLKKPPLTETIEEAIRRMSDVPDTVEIKLLPLNLDDMTYTQEVTTYIRR